ncbi:hypothetical protein ACFL3D_00655 [Candidatus Omnitrophota bacterium]
MKKTAFLCTCIAVFMSVSFIAFAFERDRTLEKIKTLEDHVKEKKYQQALNLIDVIRGDIYDLFVSEAAPEITGNTYKNHYFKLRISNPVKEWVMKKMVITDPLYKKQKRLAEDLLKIENPQSSYGLTEQLIMAAYDVGNSTEAAIVSQLDFKPTLYLKNMAHRLVEQSHSEDTELLEKEAFVFNGNAAYRIRAETDVGFDKKVMTINILMFISQQKYVLIFSFVMYAENYPVYKHILDEILNTINIGSEFDKEVNIEQRSFMDIYLTRNA